MANKQPETSVGCLVGCLVGWLVGWLLRSFVRWSVGLFCWSFDFTIRLGSGSVTFDSGWFGSTLAPPFSCFSVAALLSSSCSNLVCDNVASVVTPPLRACVCGCLGTSNNHVVGWWWWWWW